MDKDADKVPKKIKNLTAKKTFMEVCALRVVFG